MLPCVHDLAALAWIRRALVASIPNGNDDDASIITADGVVGADKAVGGGTGWTVKAVR